MFRHDPFNKSIKYINKNSRIKKQKFTTKFFSKILAKRSRCLLKACKLFFQQNYYFF